MSVTPLFQFDRAPWMDEGACAGVGHDLWFPERGATTRQAKAVCAACPVRERCLEYALTTGQKHGIWGGVSERDRRRIRGARLRAEPAPASADSGQTVDDRRRQRDRDRATEKRRAAGIPEQIRRPA